VRWSPADEGRHDDAPGVESWGFEVAAGRVTGEIRLTLDVAHGRAAFVTDLAVAGAGRFVVADEDVPLPRPQAGLDIRAEGLWASLYCETPFEHWTMGLEAFGLRLDDDVDTTVAWDRLVGERLPVGFDLEWELRGEPRPVADGDGYFQAGTLFGVLLVERDRLPVEGVAMRDHWWGGAPGVRNDPAPAVED